MRTESWMVTRAITSASERGAVRALMPTNRRPVRSRRMNRQSRSSSSRSALPSCASVTYLCLPTHGDAPRVGLIHQANAQQSVAILVRIGGERARIDIHGFRRPRDLDANQAVRLVDPVGAEFDCVGGSFRIAHA